jgi:hypothetical protein
MSEIRNKETWWGGVEKNSDGSPIQEVVRDGDVVAEIRNSETWWGGTEKNSDGTPVKEIVNRGD